MHLTPSDPDIATLYRKIVGDRLDLQPNFQRGEVWGKGKKQRLIDSIIRGWHIPPIHVIQVPGSERQEVLDGQQRLAAIRDFVDNQFPINGIQEPYESSIAELDGLTWNELPKSIRAKFEDFTIRIITISDYKPREPGELFYRLNQPTNLTSAEQRNAYFGEARQQVKNLTEHMEGIGISREILGFSNSRMAYDDVIAKFLLTLENGTLNKKITSNTVTSRYRASTGFSPELCESTRKCLDLLHLCLQRKHPSAKLNKATISSWLTFNYKALELGISIEILVEYFCRIESIREEYEHILDTKAIPNGITRDFLTKTLQIYQDRASSRVADTSSVILRDLILWGLLGLYIPACTEKWRELKELCSILHYLSQEETSFNEPLLLKMSKDINWGQSL
ncbi:TPA: DUF262 domain-containing protein [Pseudomonas aeruginosa]|nr:DUF262 domain-containing protein [Pseudomonas aeruginosa]